MSAVLDPRSDDDQALVPRVQSVARAMQMVDLIARAERGLSAKQLSSMTGVSRSATYHLLYTLTQTEVLGRMGNRYLMGPRAEIIAAGVGRHRPPREQVIATAHALEAEVGEPVVVAAWADPGITVVGRTGSASIAHELNRGFSRWGHARASGKLLLALGSRPAREQFLRTHPLEARTARTLTDRRKFEAQLDSIRERGLATDEEEFLPNVSCMAAALETTRGQVALCIVAPTRRFNADRADFESALRLTAGSFAPPALVLAPSRHETDRMSR